MSRKPSIEVLAGGFIYQVSENRTKFMERIQDLSEESDLSVCTDNYKENDCEAPYLNSLLEVLGGANYLTQVNPFIIAEFDNLLSISCDVFAVECFSGKGRKPSVIAKDAFIYGYLYLP